MITFFSTTLEHDFQILSQSHISTLLSNAQHLLACSFHSPSCWLQIFSSVKSFFDRSHRMSSAKIQCVEFVGNTCRDHLAHLVEIGENSALNISQWFQAFIKLLWQLKDANLYATEFILNQLLSLGQQHSSNTNSNTNLFEPLRVYLVPFFFTLVNNRRIFGPFIDLPARLQRRALELLFYFESNLGQTFNTSLVECCVYTHFDHVTRYMIEIMVERYHAKKMQFSQLFSFLISISVAFIENTLEKGRKRTRTSDTPQIDPVFTHIAWIGDVILRSATNNNKHSFKISLEPLFVQWCEMTSQEPIERTIARFLIICVMSQHYTSTTHSRVEFLNNTKFAKLFALTLENLTDFDIFSQCMLPLIVSSDLLLTLVLQVLIERVDNPQTMQAMLVLFEENALHRHYVTNAKIKEMLKGLVKQLGEKGDTSTSSVLHRLLLSLSTFQVN